MSSATAEKILSYKRPPMYPKQEDAIFCPERMALIEASTKSGKAQPLTALVYTPQGPVAMGSLSVGEMVCTPNGTAMILGVYPQDGARSIYRVTFSDGSWTECTDDHLWEVHDDRRDYRRGFIRRLVNDPTMARRIDFRGWPRVLPLAEIARYSPKRLRRLWIPVTAPVSFCSRETPLDPYLVGLLIGDGGLTAESIRFSSLDPEIIAHIERVVAPFYRVRHAGGCDYVISLHSISYQHVPLEKRLIPTLRSLGLWGKYAHEKRVPALYRYNDAATRLAVLQGVLDTDGYVAGPANAEIIQTSETLAADIAELVESLGGMTRTVTKQAEGRLAYRTRITIADPSSLFRLPRKRDALRLKRREVKRTFRSIEYMGIAPAQCIEIDDPRGVYLTDRFICTHNTVGCMTWLTEQAMLGQKGRNYWWIAPIKPQARIAFRRLKDGLPARLYSTNETEIKLTLANGTHIWFKGADDPDSLYGEDVYAAVVDEASRCKETAWHAVRSTLTQTRGPIRIIGNVKGKRNWFYKLCRRAQSGTPGMHYAKITAFDAVAAGVLDSEEIEEAQRDLPDHVFQELYMAQAADDGSNPFGMRSIAACTGPLSFEPTVAWGVDLAKNRDWTVAIGMDADGAVSEFERWQHVSWRMTTRKILDLVGDTPAYVDSTGVGDPILEALQGNYDLADEPGSVLAGRRTNPNFTGFKFSAPSKQQLMDLLALAIQQLQITYPEGLIPDELGDFEYRYAKSGVTYEPSEGSADDCVMALGLVVKCWQENARVALPYGYMRNDRDFMLSVLGPEGVARLDARAKSVQNAQARRKAALLSYLSGEASETEYAEMVR